METLFDYSQLQAIDPTKDFAMPLDSAGSGIIIDHASPPLYAPTDQSGSGDIIVNTAEQGLQELPSSVPTTSTTAPVTDMLKNNPIITAGLILGACYFFGVFKKKKKR